MARGRRAASLALGGTLALATVVACDSGTTAQDPPSPSTSASPADPGSGPSGSGSPQQPVQLTFAVYGDKDVTAAYRRIAATFTTQAEQTDVEVTAYPSSVRLADAVEASAGTGQGPDVFLIDQLQLPRLVAAGALAPLDEALDERGLHFGDDFQRSALTTFSADAQLQCMPIEMSPLVVYYNRRLVPRQELLAQGHEFPRGADSWSWESFEATARTVAERDLLGPVKGTYLPPSMDLVTAFVRSGGDDVVDDEGAPTTLTLSGEGAVETLTAIHRLATDRVVSLTPTDLARRDPVGWFTTGDLGMLVGTRADLPRLRAARGLDFGVVSLPSFGRSTSVSDAVGMCVSADSDAIGAASDLVAYAVGPRAARIAAETGELVPSRLDTLSSDAFTEPRLPPRRHEAFVAGAKRSEPLPYSRVWPEVTATAGERLERLLSPRMADLGPRALTRRLGRLDEASRSLFAEGSGEEPTGDPTDARTNGQTDGPTDGPTDDPGEDSAG